MMKINQMSNECFDRKLFLILFINIKLER